MKNVLSKFIVAAMVLSLATASFAQAAGPRPGQGGAGRTGAQGGPGMANREEMMKKVEAIKKKIAAELKLTPDQINKLKALDKKNSDKMRAFREKNQGKTQNRDAMMAELKKMRDAQAKEMKAILGAKFDKYQARMREETMKLRGGPGGTRTGAGKAGAGGKTGGGKAGG